MTAKRKSAEAQAPFQTGARPRALRPDASALGPANEKLVDALARAEERESELLAIGELRERLLAIVSHDLRTPLNTVSMAAGVLAASKTLGPVESKLASQIVESSKRMEGIVAQLLEFTRARLGKAFPLTCAPVDLGDVVRAVVEERHVVSRAEIRVESYGDLRGMWDADRLSDVVANLLTHAIDHAKPGTPVVVSVSAKGGPQVSCSVQHEGPPIPPEVQSVLFEPFHQGDGLASEARGNLGLGLYIAHTNVRAHGGTLDAVSANGHTVFTFELPRSA